jgi:arylsulfatase A-like enzyme
LSDRPNIVVLMTDQQRADCLGAAGHPVVRTPHMDRLAAEGLRFTNAYTTCPICMPARSSFLAGTYCHNHGQWTNVGRLPENADTYCHRLTAVGYRTCHVGKSHLYSHRGGHHLDEMRPFMNALGWDDVLETTGPWATLRTDSIMTDRWKERGCLDTFRDDYRKRREAGPTRALWPSPMPPGEHADAFVGDTAVDYISGYDRSRPLLLFVGFGGPHEPWDPPADWAAKYDPAAMDPALPVTEPGPWVPPAAAEHQRALQNDGLALTPEITGQIRALYYAKISHVDSHFGRILERLESRGMLDDTWIIFWSDHGEMLGDKGRLMKQVFYESSARVPLVVRPPRGAADGLVSESLVSQIDVYPTILEIAGAEPKPDCFGTSLVPFADEPTLKAHDVVASEIDASRLCRKTMIRDERHKLVVSSDGAELSLYDLIDDPAESINLIGKPGTEDTVARLRDRMLTWLLETQAPQARPRPKS